LKQQVDKRLVSVASLFLEWANHHAKYYNWRKWIYYEINPVWVKK